MRNIWHSKLGLFAWFPLSFVLCSYVLLDPPVILLQCAKLESSDATDRAWACAAVSNLINNDPSTRRLLQSKNVVGVLIARLSDSVEEVIVEAAGALRYIPNCLAYSATPFWRSSIWQESRYRRRFWHLWRDAQQADPRTIESPNPEGKYQTKCALACQDLNSFGRSLQPSLLTSPPQQRPPGLRKKHFLSSSSWQKTL